MTFREILTKVAQSMDKLTFHDVHLSDNQYIRLVDEFGRAYVFSNSNFRGGQCDCCHFDPKESKVFVSFSVHEA